MSRTVIFICVLSYIYYMTSLQKERYRKNFHDKKMERLAKQGEDPNYYKNIYINKQQNRPQTQDIEYYGLS